MFASYVSKKLMLAFAELSDAGKISQPTLATARLLAI